MLSSHSVVSLSITVRPCSPWGGRWIRHRRTTFGSVCFAPSCSAKGRFRWFSHHRWCYAFDCRCACSGLRHYTTWLTACSSAPHSQTAEEAMPHLYKQERKRPTPVDGGADEAGMSTAAPIRSAVLCSWIHQGQGGCTQRCRSCTLTGASKPPQDVNFLRTYSRCRRYVTVLSNVTPRYLGSEQKHRVSLLKLTLSSFLLLCCWDGRLPTPFL